MLSVISPLLCASAACLFAIVCVSVCWKENRKILSIVGILQFRRPKTVCHSGFGMFDLFVFPDFYYLDKIKIPYRLEEKTSCNATSRLYCHYKPFVLSLQAVCTVTTSCLYCRYKPFVVHHTSRKIRECGQKSTRVRAVCTGLSQRVLIESYYLSGHRCPVSYLSFFPKMEKWT